ncbi:ATP-binding cassette domain-containing protein [Pseudomonas sp. PCH446]
MVRRNPGPVSDERSADRPGRDRPQVPEADGVRGADGVRESGAGTEDRQVGMGQPAARLSGEQKDGIARVLETIRLSGSVNRPAGLLSHGQKQFLEIGMLLVQDPQLLLLDEPVAA